MLTPFAPFFVLFCHVIETLDMRDLETIQTFAASLEKLRDASKTAEKLYTMCQAMCDVAHAYHEDMAQGQQEMGFSDEFDVYLSQMGLVPQGWTPNVAQASDMTDWFFGSRTTFE